MDINSDKKNNEIQLLLDELLSSIKMIRTEYDRINNLWTQKSKAEGLNVFNQKKKQVVDLQKETDLLIVVMKYRDFMNDNFLDINKACIELESRVKNKNSVEYKINNYIQNHEEGKISINKCLNDLFGLRITVSENYDIKTLISNLKSVLDDNLYKVVDSSKDEYKAIHVYFKQDNYCFQWELQIWKDSDKMTNLNSHKQYKQSYIEWEKKVKEGSKS